MPILKIHIDNIVSNFQHIRELCEQKALELVTVTKVCHSVPAVIGPLVDHGMQMIGDCHIQNMAPYSAIRKMLLLATLSELAEMQICDVIYLSDMRILTRVAEFAVSRGKRQQVVLGIELGDLRDGIPLRQLGAFIERARKLEGIELLGLGSNLGCLVGKLPAAQTMELLDEVVHNANKSLAYNMPVVSLGGTVIYDMIKNNSISKNITQVRIGEAIFFGYNMSYQKPITGFSQETFTFSGEIIEVYNKDMDIGENLGYNAFGQKTEIALRSNQRRAVLDFGKLAAPPAGLVPLHRGLEIAACSHNHTVVDITQSQEDFQAGDLLHFRPNYNSTAQAMLSPYVKKEFIAP